VGFFYTKRLTCEFVTRIIGLRVKISHKSYIFRLFSRSVEFKVQRFFKAIPGVCNARQQLLGEN